VAAGKSAILGVSSNGAVLRSADMGVTWSGVALPKGEGFLAQLAMNDRGEAVAVFAPQRFLASTDDGATFASLASTGIGVVRLDTSTTDDLLVEGVGVSTSVAQDGLLSLRSSGSGPYAVLRASPARFEKVDKITKRSRHVETPEGRVWLDYAEAAQAGQGVLLGHHFYQALFDSNLDEPAVTVADAELLAVSTSQKNPTSTHVAKLSGCEGILLGGAKKTLVVGCGHVE